jgi:hypothetical protein
MDGQGTYIEWINTLAPPFYTVKLNVTGNGSQNEVITLPNATGTVALTSDIPTAYTNTDVDTHLNTGTANNNEVLSWTGTDYDWVAQTGGTGISEGTNNTSQEIILNADSWYVSGYWSPSASVLQLEEAAGGALTIRSTRALSGQPDNKSTTGRILFEADSNFYAGIDAFGQNATTKQGSIQLVVQDDTTTREIVEVNSTGLNLLHGVTQLPILTSAPSNPAEGMVTIADGTSWDPLSNGVKSMVVYLNSAWRQIAIANV